MACFPVISWALVHLWLSCVVHGDVRRHPRISGILMESRHPVADGGGTGQTGSPSGAEIRTGAWAEQFLVGPVHPSPLCQIGESDQGRIPKSPRNRESCRRPSLAITAISAVCSSIADSFFCWAVSQSTRRSRHMPFRHRDLLFSELLHEQRVSLSLFPFASV